MAHKKGGGSSRNGRDSNSQKRGVKVYGGTPVPAGNILVRQVGLVDPRLWQERGHRARLHAVRPRRGRGQVRVEDEHQEAGVRLSRLGVMTMGRTPILPAQPALAVPIVAAPAGIIPRGAVCAVWSPARRGATLLPIRELQAPRHRRGRDAAAPRRHGAPRGSRGHRAPGGERRGGHHRHGAPLLGHSPGGSIGAASPGPIACVPADGSHIVDLGDDTALFHASIAGADAALLRDVLQRHGPASFLFADDTIVHDADGAAFAGYVSTWSPRVDVVARVAEHPYWEHERGLMAVVAVAPEAAIRAAAAELEHRLHHATTLIVFPVHRIGMFAAMLVRAAPGPPRGPPSSGSRATTAARSPRRSSWGTGSTTCRCSRSPAAPS